MFTNWLTYRATAERLNIGLSGSRIAEVFSQEKNELIIVLEKEREELFLHFSSHPRFSYLLLRTEFARARKNSVDLMDELLGQEIISVEIAKNDRVIRITLTSGQYILVFLYSLKANLHLIDAQGITVNSFKHKFVQIPPEFSFGNSLPDIDRQEIISALTQNPDLPVEHALKEIQPYLTGIFAEELLFRINIEAGTRCGELHEATREHLLKTIGELILESKSAQFYVYTSEDLVPTHFSLVELRCLSEEKQITFGELNEALFFYLRKRLSGESCLETKKRVLNAIAHESKRLQNSLSHQESPEKLNKRADEYEKFGNLLMIHLFDHPEQPWRITVPDIFVDPKLVISIPLQEGRSLLENAQRYFEKARNLRVSIDYVLERIKTMSLRLDQLEEFKRIIESVHDIGELKKVMNKEKERMTSIGLTGKGEKEKTFPFRRFTVSGGFEVWVGKSSENNDELTVHHAKPNDIWFHARGVGGSHVVIKVGTAPGQPSKEAIREAASIAAYYSKHRKAKSVPVAYTEKKYVRKPKKTPPGTVILEREKVIMVEPKLPEKAESASDT